MSPSMPSALVTTTLMSGNFVDVEEVRGAKVVVALANPGVAPMRP